MSWEIKRIYEQYWHERIKELSGGDKKEETPHEIFDTVSSVLETGNKILDVGCGDGFFSHYIKDKFKKMYGAEIVGEVALIAQKQNIIVSVMDLNMSLSYKDNTFDAVICSDVIEHLFDPGLLLTEIYRVLRPNGQLVLTTPNIRNFRNLYTLVFKGIFPQTSPDTFVWGGGHLHFFTREDIKNIFNKAGFKRIEFFINQGQFRLSKKRKIIRFLTGEKTFGEWFCGSITISAYRES
jgi:methionine biosynthesis protein MetW